MDKAIKSPIVAISVKGFLNTSNGPQTNDYCPWNIIVTLYYYTADGLEGYDLDLVGRDVKVIDDNTIEIGHDEGSFIKVSAVWTGNRKSTKNGYIDGYYLAIEYINYSSNVREHNRKVTFKMNENIKYEMFRDKLLGACRRKSEEEDEKAHVDMKAFVYEEFDMQGFAAPHVSEVHTYELIDDNGTIDTGLLEFMPRIVPRKSANKKSRKSRGSSRRSSSSRRN